MEQSGRAKSLGRKFLQFPLVRLAVLGPAFFLFIGISNGFLQKFAGAPLSALGSSLLMAAAGLTFYYFFVRLVEDRPVEELSLSSLGPQLGLGCLLGSGLCFLCFTILMLLGVYHLEGVNPLPFVLPALAMSISSGVLEELMWRGGLFRILEEWKGSWVALAVSALVFGLSHYSSSPGALWGCFAITIEAGLLLAAVYLVTRRLWLGIGFHLSWNFAQSGVFSGIVSANFSHPGLFRSTLTGPTILTGGPFGLEASLVSILVCSVTGLAMLRLAHRRGQLKS